MTTPRRAGAVARSPASASGDGRPVVIMHVDMDAFYALVELRRRPELIGRPVLIGGATRGVVLSATYAAREHGITGGMPMTKARRLCPEAVILPPDFDAYIATSRGIRAIFESVTAVVEAVSIDEAFLDLTGAQRHLGSPAMIGELVRAKVHDEQGITCSAGIAPTKFVAKLASNAAKPDGLREIRPDAVVSFLHQLPVEAMWGVGDATAGKLHRLGLYQVADLAYTARSVLQRAFGPRHGALLHDLAWGRDPRPVIARLSERSVGSQETFGRDSDDEEVVRRELLRLADRIAARLRAAGVLGRTVVLNVRFADFSELSRSGTLRAPTDAGGEIHARSIALWKSLGLCRARRCSRGSLRPWRSPTSGAGQAARSSRRELEQRAFGFRWPRIEPTLDYTSRCGAFSRSTRWEVARWHCPTTSKNSSNRWRQPSRRKTPSWLTRCAAPRRLGRCSGSGLPWPGSGLWPGA